MSKTLIFLFDGTANDATEGPYYSNVYAINQLIADQNQMSSGHIRTQVTFYMPGVGTKFTAKKGFTAEKQIQRLFGDDLEQLILRAYINLCANYHPLDEIALIGFSRGAVAARIFSRLVSDFGILESDMLLYLGKVWPKFVEISEEKDDPTYHRKIEEFRREIEREAKRPVFNKPKGKPIRFLGVFDTVSGAWDNTFLKNINLRDPYPAAGVRHVLHLMSMHDTRFEFSLRRFVTKNDTTDVKEIWLPGVHSDIGGGYEERFISNVSLLTMASALKVFGKIALNKAAVDQVRKELHNQVAIKNFVINAEPSRILKQIRTISRNDDIHPLHYFWIKKDIRWKNDDGLVTYRDETRIKEKRIPFLRKFDVWVNRKKSDARSKPANSIRGAVEQPAPAAK
jgi:uncharacterized protein (DUF2235 family)